MKERLLAASVAVSMAIAVVPAALAHGERHSQPKAVDYSKAEDTAFGRAGNPKKAHRTIRVGMDDSMHFKVTASGDIVVKRGETIRFLVRNDGKLPHEMVIGTMKDLQAHAEMMRKFPEMEHEEAHMTHVAPGKEGEIVWQFTRPGEFHYACLVPGHMEAGMIAKITVK